MKLKILLRCGLDSLCFLLDSPCCVTLHFVSAAFPFGFIALSLFFRSFVPFSFVSFRLRMVLYCIVLLYLDSAIPGTSVIMPCSNMIGVLVILGGIVSDFISILFF